MCCNVKIWRKVADEVAKDYPDVTLGTSWWIAELMLWLPILVDLMSWWRRKEIFSEIFLSDGASVLTGTLGFCLLLVMRWQVPVSMNLSMVRHQILQVRALPIRSVWFYLFAHDAGRKFWFGPSRSDHSQAVEAVFAQGILLKDLGGSASTKKWRRLITQIERRSPWWKNHFR